MTLSPSSYDIIIVGAGMVGSCLALTLSQSSKFQIALVEANLPVPNANDISENAYDLRVSAITRASENIFKNIGIWQDIEAKRVSIFRKMHVWDTARIGEIHFDSATIGESHLGHIIENKIIQSVLLEACKKQNNIDLYLPGHLNGIIQKDQNISIRLEEGSCLNSSLLVGADGAQSKVRELVGISNYCQDYQQKGLVATIHTEKSHEETAWQRFLLEGVLAFLPLQDPHQCSIVWSTRSEEAERLCALDNPAFSTALSTAFEYRLGATQVMSPRAAFPLSTHHVKTYVQPRLALVGDAAHIIHPLAGQGVNLGLLDAAVLAEVLTTAKKIKDPGDFLTLRRFERWRKGDNFTTQLAIDALKRLFSSTLLPIQVIRNLGLTATDKITPIKHLIMRQASGLTGDLPSLARGGFNIEEK
ncbi:ubiquinone biosynthesis hydroxylase UbiH/UbiF/VisC/COQ6 family [Candidatus Nitrosoglobus terrae]|uniref:Ubiquinone biosynthesis hydroxylase UbiH/UbiF/VisC/COQ6 family n=1 Tax=Candidatus Nitrosoglobus terrae TaxID=1630141 RepID=A0A1Q2SKT5_9GAMM|nr:UbiH/UbiF/VisC/COQ6 family ubiquinone biosynthesis hydroxylase [Candidatus Nitrosoglobus terrae]BAW79761.1 ubiquinone biosynthesis hydroxylase UbiH/UbiF/VisC/COQ6 family [Candidatus Nitrosoglobus terrae]